MRVIMPKWLIVTEIILAITAIVVLGYKAATRVLPFPVEAIPQARSFKKPPPQPTIFDYYRKYPDRYIRLEDEMWVLDRDSHVATHNFSLHNLAVVAYTDIEVRITYAGPDGKTLLTQDIKIQGVLQGQSKREFSKMKVSKIPEITKNAVITVTKGRVVE